MATINNLRSLLRKLEKYERESTRENNGSVVVGYSAGYAVYVHENLQAAHGTLYNLKHQQEVAYSRALKKARIGEARPFRSRGPNQQAKFLEQPAREMKTEIAQIVVTAMKNGASLVEALLIAGNRLQRASQQIVPVDTGNLKGSAFTERE